jgi:nicotinamidase-related amidase
MPKPCPPVLLLIDWQKAFADEAHWGGNLNNPEAETNATRLLAHWRKKKFPLIHIVHDSTHADSPLKTSLPGGAIVDTLTPKQNEPVLVKHVNSGFIGTDLETRLHALGAHKLVICGMTTNHCISTTARMAGNLGFKVMLVGDACATFDRIGPDGTHYSSQLVHDLSLANIHDEFCTVTTTAKVLG